jgi:hypothetical protein
VAQRGKKSAVYGALTDERGNGAPVTVEGAEVIGPEERAGYAPERLDRAIQAFLLNTEASAGMLLRYGPTLTGMLEKLKDNLDGALRALNIPTDGEVPPGVPQTFKDFLMCADDMARILERVAKIVSASSKAADDITRLRVFMVGGDEEDNGLSGKGENELRRMVAEAYGGFKPPESV